MTGILIVNLGTPDAPTVPAVRKYLREFLMDPEVIDIPSILRWLLVNLIIAPFRAPKSTQAYQKIWYPEGSPLLIHSEELCAALQSKLPEHRVVLAMRYGQPSIESALQQLKDCKEIVVLPLYPQYAGATTKTVLDKVHEAVSAQFPNIKIQAITSFYEEEAYITDLASLVKEHTSTNTPDHLLMSYHGLPIRQLPCVKDNVYLCKGGEEKCPAVDPAFPNCYRSHCYATSRALANHLGLREDEYSVSFQSRLGKIPWIQPYTSDHIHSLVQKGVRHLAVICPAFVSDCLETLEEINMEIRKEFLDAGGEEFTYIPCLNGKEEWAETLLRQSIRE